jgi:hypothetical protein
LDLHLKKELSKVVYSEYSFLWCWNLNTSESRSKIPGKFWNVVLEKDGEDQLDWSRDKWSSITQGQGGEEYLTYNTKKEG